MARIKAKAEAVPSSREEADTLLGQIGALQREVERIEADLSDQVSRSKADAKKRADPLVKQAEAKFVALMAWANASRETLLVEGRKSLALSQGTIGWRRAPPAVRVEKGQEDAVIAALEAAGLTDLLREVVELDKEAILREPARVGGIPDIMVEQAEHFWIKPLDVRVERKATSAKVTGAAVAPAEEAA